MRAWNKKHKPKHWTKPKWYSQKSSKFSALLSRGVKRRGRDELMCYNMKTNKSFRHKRLEIKHLTDSMCKNKKYINGDDK